MLIYFTSCRLSAKANDTTYMLGVMMSHEWKYIGLEKLAQANATRCIETSMSLRRSSPPSAV
ncbi:hypothetical protein BC835DRAFT_1381033 [Cytidiella melzeri]|nr:hypothetical protein BC835DRAFT_1381033 [Cytidiella melzeri]